MITLQEIKQNESIKALVRAGNRYLEALGYTDHGPRHLGYVSRTASGILKSLGYSEREVELAAIAGWVHDVGNSVNRHDHGPNGAILLFPLLREIGMDIEDVMIIITAVGNHEEQSGTVSSAVSAAWPSPINRTRTRAACATAARMWAISMTASTLPFRKTASSWTASIRSSARSSGWTSPPACWSI